MSMPSKRKSESKKSPNLRLPTVSSIDWKPETVQTIYRDWGIYYTHKQKLKTAAHYYGKSLELKSSDHQALYNLSRCKREIAQPESALEDCAAALKFGGDAAYIDFEYCNALYETNDFESTKVRLHSELREYSGNKIKSTLQALQSFQDRMDVVNETFKDTVGPSLDAFLHKNEMHFAGIMKDLQQKRVPQTRPLWKVLRDSEKCDVLSIPEVEESMLSPREVARRQQSFKVFNQIYFNEGWIDMLFLKELRQNRSLLLPQSFYSTPILKQTAHTKYEIVKKFLKMLHARSPIYNEYAKRFPNKGIHDNHRNTYLDRVQYQTRRNVQSTLRAVRQMRKMGQLKKLSQFVEEFMGDYIVLKTYRTLPWKYEFVHEVYNILALAHADRYFVPENLLRAKPNNRLFILLSLPIPSPKEVKEYVFGDRDSEDAEAFERTNTTYKKYVARLEKRLRFAKYGIERTYLLHCIANEHLTHGRFDECYLTARKAIEEARRLGSNLWEFLSMMAIFKSLTMTNKIEKARVLLREVKLVVGRLNDPKIYDFIELCCAINEEELLLKQRQLSYQSLRLNRSTRKSTSNLSSRSQSKISKRDSRQDVGSEDRFTTSDEDFFPFELLKL